MRRAKIVCTIGPASESPEMLRKLITAGLDVARLNFSHGTHEQHARTITAIREAAAAATQLTKELFKGASFVFTVEVRDEDGKIVARATVSLDIRG